MKNTTVRRWSSRKRTLDDIHIVWDLEDEPGGNVQHLQEHDVTMDEIEDVLYDRASVTTISRSSGEPITFGYTSTGRYLAVVWEHVQDDPLTMRPITAYDAPELTQPSRKRKKR